MFWDFTEVFPLSGKAWRFRWRYRVGRACLRNTRTGWPFTRTGISSNRHKESSTLEASANAFITDPPYYDAVPYAYLSDFFYVWLRRMLFDVQADLLSAEAVPKEDEIVVDRPHECSQ